MACINMDHQSSLFKMISDANNWIRIAKFLLYLTFIFYPRDKNFVSVSVAILSSYIYIYIYYIDASVLLENKQWHIFHIHTSEDIEFYLLVVKIFHSFATLIRKILFSPLEDEIHIFASPCNIVSLSLYIYCLKIVHRRETRSSNNRPTINYTYRCDTGLIIFLCVLLWIFNQWILDIYV